MTRVLALDVGTSSVRARAYDERCREVEGAEAQQRYEAEDGTFDPDELVDATRAALDVARSASGDIAAVTASCFWHSVVPVGADGRARGRLLTWRDQRSIAEAEELAERLDAEAVHARTGCHLHPSYWPAKLLWLRRHEPDLFRSARWFLSFPDYLYGRLAGAAHTSLSMASATGLLDVHRGVWDEELLGALELDPERLPEISDEPTGDPPWYPALGDGACSNVGAGCTTRESAALMIGTSGAYRVVFEADRAEPRAGLFLYRLDGRRFVEGGSVSDGGNLWEWLHDTVNLDDEEVSDRPPGANGVTFLALLGGERAPGWNGRARGAITGLTFETEPADLLQAALEGTACRFAEIVELLPEVREIVATGHALLANRGWVELIADVLERPVTLSAVEEASARGAAAVALERLGLTPPDAPAGPTIDPRPERAEAYRELRERQRELYRYVT